MKKILAILLVFAYMVPTILLSETEDAFTSNTVEQKNNENKVEEAKNNGLISSIWCFIGTGIGFLAHKLWRDQKIAEKNEENELLRYSANRRSEENAQLRTQSQELQQRVELAHNEIRQLKAESERMDEKARENARHVSFEVGQHIAKRIPEKEQKVLMLRERRRLLSNEDFCKLITQTVIDAFQNDDEIEALLELDEVKSNPNLLRIFKRFMELGYNVHDAQGVLFQELLAELRKIFKEPAMDNEEVQKKVQRKLWGSVYNDPRLQAGQH